MRSIHRKTELARLVDVVRRKVDTLASAANSGTVSPPVHASVVAPASGGLSLFLRDADDAVGELQGVKPVAVTFETTDDWERVVAEALTPIATGVGLSLPHRISIEDLFRVAQKSYERGQFIVLLIDAGRAIASIEGDERWRKLEDRNPFLQWLRGLVNRLTDVEPPLAVVVGWREDFLDTSRAWKTNDVVQRYPAVVSLYSDFESDDAWSIYEEILGARGVSISGGPYPGFPRSRFPVGKILARIGNASVDGATLLNLLRGERAAFGPHADDIPDDLLIRLCLKDETIPLSDPILADARIQQRLLSVANRGSAGLVANDLLYGAVGITPPQYRVSLVQQLIARFQERDPKLAIELLDRVALSIAPGSNYSVADAESFGKVRVPLPKALLPAGSLKMSVDIFCSFQSQVPRELLQAVQQRLEEIEKAPALWTAELVLVLVSDPAVEDEIRRAVGEYAKKLGSAVEVGTGWRARSCATATLSQDDAVRLSLAVAVSDAGAVQPQRGLLEHFRYVQQNIPPIGSGDLQSFASTGLVARPLERIRQSELGVPKAAELARVLVSADILKKSGGVLFWDPVDDQFLSALSDAIESDDAFAEVARDYWIAPENWGQVLSSAVDAYTNDYLEVRNNRPVRVDVAHPLAKRVLVVTQQSEPSLNSLPTSLRPPFSARIADARTHAENANPDVKKCKECLEDLAQVREQMAAALRQAEQDRAAAVAQVRLQIQQLTVQTSFDPELQNRRDIAIGNAEVIVTVPERAGELPEVIEDLSAIAEEFTRDARRFAQNQALAKQVSDKLKAVRDGIAGLPEGVESVRKTAEQVSASAEVLEHELQAIQQSVSSTKKQAHDLSELQEKASQLALKIADAERRVRKLVKPEGKAQGTATPGKPALTPQIATAQKTSSSPSAAPKAGEPEEEWRTRPVTSAPVTSALAAVAPTVAAPTVAAPTPAAPTPAAPTPAAPTPAAPTPAAPTPVVPTPVAPTPAAPTPAAPTPAAPTVAAPTVAAPTVAAPAGASSATAAQVQYRRKERQFVSSEQGIQELIDFLSSDPRITGFDIE